MYNGRILGGRLLHFAFKVDLERIAVVFTETDRCSDVEVVDKVCDVEKDGVAGLREARSV